MKKSIIPGTWQQKRGFSPAVITEGASKIVWLAGHSGQTDDDGRSLAGDFDAQCRQTFRNIEKTLVAAHCKLTDLVTMTVFLIDARYTQRMREVRAEFFADNFPGSAAITVTGFAEPTMMIEIQGFAVSD
ncbi:MAG TPA: RidA family protein [Xanthobacteraceae bacterium]|jgi:enamine deaminase RidA (YjgF/YER057c/UK114 family)